MTTKHLPYSADPPLGSMIESSERHTIASYEHELKNRRLTELRLREALEREEALLCQKDDRAYSPASPLFRGCTNHCIQEYLEDPCRDFSTSVTSGEGLFDLFVEKIGGELRIVFDFSGGDAWCKQCKA